MLRSVLVLVLLGALAAPAAAFGAQQIAPPGKAGATQYFETIPTSRGNVAPPGAAGASGSGTPTSTSSSSAPTGPTLATVGAGKSGTHRLSKLGAAGESAAGFAKATAPPVPTAATSGTTAARQSLRAPASGTALGGLAALITGSDAGGIGVFMPLLLGLTLLAALATLARRTTRG